MYSVLWPCSDLIRQLGSNGIQQNKTYVLGIAFNISLLFDSCQSITSLQEC